MAMVAGYLQALPAEDAVHGCDLSLGASVCGIPGDHSAGGRGAGVASDFGAFGKIRAGTHRELSPPWRCRSGRGRCSLAARKTKLFCRFAGRASGLRSDCDGAWPQAKASLLRELLEQAPPRSKPSTSSRSSAETCASGLKESLVEEAIAAGFRRPARSGQARQHAARRSRRNVAFWRRRANSRKRTCGFSIPSISCWRVRSSRRKRRSVISTMRRWKTSTTASERRRTSRDGEARLFSRTRDEITESFPELPPALAGLPKGRDPRRRNRGVEPWWAWKRLRIQSPEQTGGRALPFSTLQQRLGRKTCQREDDARDSRRLHGLRRSLLSRRSSAGPSSPRTGANPR